MKTTKHLIKGELVEKIKVELDKEDLINLIISRGIFDLYPYHYIFDLKSNDWDFELLNNISIPELWIMYCKVKELKNNESSI